MDDNEQRRTPAPAVAGNLLLRPTMTNEHERTGGTFRFLNPGLTLL
jgi:hypothetical protein